MRKRDKKEHFKLQRMDMSEEQLKAEKRTLPGRIEDQYIDACDRNLIKPKHFIRNIKEAYSQEHYRAAIKKKEVMETHYVSIKDV